MKTYAPRHDDHLRSPWQRADHRRHTSPDEVIAQLDEARIDAREYSDLARELEPVDIETARQYRTRANAAAHRAAAIAAYIERESPRA